MINKLILVGISIVIGISMIVVLVNIKDDIKANINETETVELLLFEDFNEGTVWPGEVSVALFKENLPYLTHIRVGTTETIAISNIEDLSNDNYVISFLYDSEDHFINILPYMDSLEVEDTGFLVEIIGDGKVHLIFKLPIEATGILPTLIDLLPIIATLILITTAVIVIKKQN